MYDYVVVHYNEIAIKGDNRIVFERKLISNIKRTINIPLTVSRRYGLVIIKLNKDTNIQEIKEKLQFLPGIAYFSFAKTSKLDINDIKSKSYALLEKLTFNSFKVSSKRGNKAFKIKSPEINRIVGECIFEDLNKKVNLRTPDITLFIEIGEQEAFIYTEKVLGVGGLPIGSGAKVVCSLSGGLDSPVAAFQFMKRGCEVVYVHIYNNTLVKKSVMKKIQKLVIQLNKIQLKSKLYIVPFADIQKEIISYIPSQYRMIIYRRYMMKIINELAKKENAKAIITGDSVGQVASQTLENINCIYDASNLPVLAPLITYNKDDIVHISKKISTYDISIIQYPDCCSFMIAKHPETKANLRDILKLEEPILTKEAELVSNAIKKAEIFKY